ncbi:MAG: DEAD/DEAH box helicase, partial [Actinomycetales bacterium]
ITDPFPIQQATLPDGIAGRDLLARARTGSGKTLAYGLAALSRLNGVPAIPDHPQALVLVPTRELAMQVIDDLSGLAEACGVRIRLVAGGMPYASQVRAIERGVHLLVATPGRLVDLVQRGSVQLDQVRITVLDEADQLADMGFMPVVRQLLDLTKPGGQRLLFSATLDGDVDALVRDYLRNPARHEVDVPGAAVPTMDHHVLVVHPADRQAVTEQIGARPGRTIFFVRTQAGADRLADRLAARGVAAQALHGGKSQAVSTRTLKSFRDGLTPALVATNVAARGIHVEGISLVVHVDAPADPKDYLHRAGRTARAGESGTVVTLISPKQQREVARMTSKAGVSPHVARIRPMDEHLVAVTGAREPSGIAWEPTRAVPERAVPERVGAARSRARRPTRGSQDWRPRTPGGREGRRSDRPAAGRSRPKGR